MRDIVQHLFLDWSRFQLFSLFHQNSRQAFHIQSSSIHVTYGILIIWIPICSLLCRLRTKRVITPITVVRVVWAAMTIFASETCLSSLLASRQFWSHTKVLFILILCGIWKINNLPLKATIASQPMVFYGMHAYYHN